MGESAITHDWEAMRSKAFSRTHGRQKGKKTIREFSMEIHYPIKGMDH